MWTSTIQKKIPQLQLFQLFLLFIPFVSFFALIGCKNFEMNYIFIFILLQIISQSGIPCFVTPWKQIDGWFWTNSEKNFESLCSVWNMVIFQNKILK